MHINMKKMIFFYSEKIYGTVQILMKCRILRHFIWVFTFRQRTHLGVSIMWHFIRVITVCQSTHLGVSSIQRVNSFLHQVDITKLKIYSIADDGGSLLCSSVDPQLKQVQIKVNLLYERTAWVKVFRIIPEFRI